MRTGRSDGLAGNALSKRVRVFRSCLACVHVDRATSR
jgi:hypothetical protein